MEEEKKKYIPPETPEEREVIGEDGFPIIEGELGYTPPTKKRDHSNKNIPKDALKIQNFGTSFCILWLSLPFTVFAYKFVYVCFCSKIWNPLSSHDDPPDLLTYFLWTLITIIGAIPFWGAYIESRTVFYKPIIYKEVRQLIKFILVTIVELFGLFLISGEFYTHYLWFLGIPYVVFIYIWLDGAKRRR